MEVAISKVPYVFVIKNRVGWFYQVGIISCSMDVYQVAIFVAQALGIYVSVSEVFDISYETDQGEI